MSLNRFALALCCAVCIVLVFPVTAFGEDDPIDPTKGWGKIQLLEPFSDQKKEVSISGPQETVLEYLKPVYDWAIVVGVGIVTLWVLISGTAIILVGGDASERGKWIKRFMVAVAGLVVLVLWGVILRFLNALFFV